MLQQPLFGPLSFLHCSHQCSEKGQQWQQALGVLAAMQQTAVLPEAISYSAAISACEKGLQRQQVAGV